MSEGECRVCVTGGAGYIGSWLIRKLLRKGYIVHATLRDLGDESKVELLKRLSRGAEGRFLLFEADIYDAKEFEPAIRGCEFVFLVATPKLHNVDDTRFRDTTEAAVSAVRIILESCKRTGTVRRVIYTGSVTSSSPLKEDGTGFKEFMDESCWTPLHLSFAHCGDYAQSYTSSKTSAEKALLRSNEEEEEENGLEVVSLVCGLVGGDSLLPNAPLSIQSMTSPLTGNAYCYKNLMFLQALLGSIPLVHNEDLCDAHIFCIEKSSMSGRYICAGAYPTLLELQLYYEQKYSVSSVIKEVEGNEEGIPCNSRKLIDAGFKYAYDMKKICDGSVDYMKRLEALNEII